VLTVTRYVASHSQLRTRLAALAKVLLPARKDTSATPNWRPCKQQRSDEDCVNAS